MSPLGPPPPSSSLAASKRMRANRRRDTAPELALRRELHHRGFRFRVDLPIDASGLRARPDIAFTAARLAIYVDGCFWHCCPEHGSEPKANSGYWREKLAENVSRDERTTVALEDAGWRVLRFWAHVPAPTAADRVVQALGR